jgi:hypothetical protein
MAAASLETTAALAARGLWVTHLIPGRIRVRIPRLRRNPALAEAIRARLSSLDCVRRVEASPVTAGVLVVYDPAAIAVCLPEVLEAAKSLRLLAPEVEAAQVLSLAATWPGQRPTGTGASAAAVSVNRAFEQLDARISRATDHQLDLKTLIPLALLVGAAVGLLRAPRITAPAWYTLLWYSFNTFRGFHARLFPGPSVG